MPLTVYRGKPSLHDHITELQRKLQLLEGERTAFYERSQVAIKKNRESILQMRQESKKLYKQVADANAGDERIIKVAFHNRGLEKDAFRNLTGKEAITALDQKVLSKTKRLNALKHTTQTCQQRLEELNTEEERRKHACSGRAASSDAWACEKEEDAMSLRALANRLEKAQFKCKEAEKCTLIHLKLKSHLQDESLTYGDQINSLEAEILKYREELHNLQILNNEAQLSKKAAKAELQQLEEQLSKEQKERESNIARSKQKTEERKSQAEKAEKKVQRTIMQPDELSSEAQHSTTRIAAEEEKAISTFEEAFRSIKEATGVTDIQEVVEHFIFQKENHQHLEKLKQENEEVLLQLTEQKELLGKQFEDMKYSGEAKLSSEQQMLEECEHQLQLQQQRCDAAAERLGWQVKTLGTIRAGVEHLAGKLQHILLTEDSGRTVRPGSDEFVLEILTQCELKLQMLLKKLEGKDLASITKEIDEYEFYTRIEGKLPDYNTKVKLPEDQTEDLGRDEGETKEEETDIMSREALKRQSQLIVDSNSTKKAWKSKI
ncbi:coiled-coil domain-containing protein 151 [Fundulus diaphanus]